MDNNKSSLYFWFFVVLNLIVFSILFLSDIDLYDRLSREDHLAEYLTFFCFLGTSVFLALASKKLAQLKWTQKWETYLLIGGAIVFFWAAGEEISWGQRLLGFGTPEELKEINAQNEVNLHNIDKKFFDRALDRGTIFGVLLGVILLIFRKTHISRIPLPDFYLLLAFGLTPFYHEYNIGVDFFALLYLPFLFLLGYAGYHKQYGLLIITILTILITVALWSLHTTFNDAFPDHLNSANEYREYLFAACCAFYGWYIWQNTTRILDYWKG